MYDMCQQCEVRIIGDCGVQPRGQVIGMHVFAQRVLLFLRYWTVTESYFYVWSFMLALARRASMACMSWRAKNVLSLVLVATTKLQMWV